jgi:hypothetical protein
LADESQEREDVGWFLVSRAPDRSLEKAYGKDAMYPQNSDETAALGA